MHDLVGVVAAGLEANVADVVGIVARARHVERSLAADEIVADREDSAVDLRVVGVVEPELAVQEPLHHLSAHALLVRDVVHPEVPALARRRHVDEQGHAAGGVADLGQHGGGVVEVLRAPGQLLRRGELVAPLEHHVGLVVELGLDPVIHGRLVPGVDHERARPGLLGGVEVVAVVVVDEEVVGGVVHQPLLGHRRLQAEAPGDGLCEDEVADWDLAEVGHVAVKVVGIGLLLAVPVDARVLRLALLLVLLAVVLAPLLVGDPIRVVVVLGQRVGVHVGPQRVGRLVLVLEALVHVVPVLLAAAGQRRQAQRVVRVRAGRLSRREQGHGLSVRAHVLHHAAAAGLHARVAHAGLDQPPVQVLRQHEHLRDTCSHDGKYEDRDRGK